MTITQKYNTTCNSKIPWICDIKNTIYDHRHKIRRNTLFCFWIPMRTISIKKIPFIFPYGHRGWALFQVQNYIQGSGLASVFSPRLIIFQKDWNNCHQSVPWLTISANFPILRLLGTDILSPGTETFKNISVLWPEILFPKPEHWYLIFFLIPNTMFQITQNFHNSKITCQNKCNV